MSDKPDAEIQDPRSKIQNPADREDIAELARVLEAVLFTAPEPLTLEALRKGLGVHAARLEAALARLAAELREGGRGLRLLRHEATVQLVTAPEMAPDLERFFGYQATQRLSPAALETLAIIAYRQPVTRPQIEAIRGVDSSGVLNTVLARGLVAEVGRLETAGHPILYGTTPAFLRHFGLHSLAELPPLDEPARARLLGNEE
jgi:segregation and condensation protein B